jgi:23S rRNA (cytidine2498-2'-O)-methyltransferase
MIVYQAVPGQEPLLEKAITIPHIRHGALFLCDHAVPDVYFFRNSWLNAEIHEFDSIGQAAKFLKSRGRNWHYFPLHEHRRASLIAEQLPKIPKSPLTLPHTLAHSQLYHSDHPIGSFTLLDKHHLLFADKCSSPFPGGIPNFQENKIDPPSRAYLKLWEALCILNRNPTENDHCLDLGACPGGWTWVLNHYAGKLTAIDRSALHPSLLNQGKIKFIQGNAFSADPKEFMDLTWLVSDVICYPEKLLECVKKWVSALPLLTMICTIKFQGEANYNIVKEFLEIPASRVIHLYHNKHELTWIRDPHLLHRSDLA